MQCTWCVHGVMGWEGRGGGGGAMAHLVIAVRCLPLAQAHAVKHAVTVEPACMQEAGHRERCRLHSRASHYYSPLHGHGKPIRLEALA